MGLCSHSADGSYFMKVLHIVLQHSFLIGGNLLCNSADRISRLLYYMLYFCT